MKKCCKCKIEQSNENFYKDSKKKDGLGYECKNCRKQRYKINIDKDREINRQRCLKHYEMNKEKYLINAKNYYEENRELVIKNSRKWQDENKERRRELARKYKKKQKDLEKSKLLVNADYKKRQKSAHEKVHYALKTGKLIKPLNCEKCNSIEVLQGHHEDYMKPLHVEWLCFKCHCLEHGKRMDIL